MLQLPGQKGQEFVLTRSFVPRGKPNILTAFIAARSDPANYGKLVVYNTPADSTAPSPLRAATRIESNPQISSQLTLLDQRGSQVDRGEVQLIPVKDAVVYVRPIWIEGSGSETFPRFQYVAMTYGDKSVLQTSVDAALHDMFGTPLSSSTPPPSSSQTGTTPPPTTLTPAAQVLNLLNDAQRNFNSAKAALARSDFAGYGQYQAKAQQDVAQAQALVSTATTSTTTPKSGSTTTTTKPASTSTTGGA
jgi:uncharacterized membrane protein (UPF0182 family)